MFQRKNAGGLPTTTPLSLPTAGDQGGGFGLHLGKSGPDGSGKAIKMDAPVVKAWKTASTFTKYSYYVMLFFILLIFVGYRYLRISNASIWLTCHAQECTLELTPPGGRTQTVVFARTQLHSVQAIKVDSVGNFLSVDSAKYEPPRGKKGKGNKKGGSYKGPDELGEYKSYAIKFRFKTPDDVVQTEDSVPDGDFSQVQQFLSKNEDDGGLHVLYMRQFGLTQSRVRIRSMINKIESYIKKRRQKLTLKESVSLPWQGILCLVFGLLGIMLTLLIGQFWEEAPKRTGGPGTRRASERKSTSSARPSARSKFVVDTGRPSKYPPGYHKKY